MDKIYVTTSISESHPAYELLEYHDNRSDFFRQVASDLVRANAGCDLDDYLEVPEKERLQTYYGVRESKEEFILNTLIQVRHFMQNPQIIRKLVLEVEYVYRWEKFADAVLGKDCTHNFCLQFVAMNTKRLVGESDMDLDITFHKDLAKYFKCVSAEISDEKYRELNEIMKQLCTAEQLFIKLTMDYCVIAEFQNETARAEDVADYILRFMEDYFQNGKASYEDIHTAFMKELKADAVGVFGSNTAEDTKERESA